MSYLILSRGYDLPLLKSVVGSFKGKISDFYQSLREVRNPQMPWDLYCATYGKDLPITPLQFAEVYTNYFGNFDNKDVDVHRRVRLVHDHIKTMNERKDEEKLNFGNRSDLEGKLFGGIKVDPNSFSWKKF